MRIKTTMGPVVDGILSAWTEPPRPEASAKEQNARKRRVRIKQIGGDDGCQWCLIIDGRTRYNGMNKREASWRRQRFIETGDV